MGPSPDTDRIPIMGYEPAHRVAQSYLGPLWIAVRPREADASGEPALLRRLHLPEGTQDSAREGICRAGREATKLRHESVLSVVDVLDAGDQLAMVYDHFEAEPLRSLQSWANLRSASFPVSVTLRIISDLLRGLHAVHGAFAAGHTPVFGGLSPDSVLVSREGDTRLCDPLIASSAALLEPIGFNTSKLAYAAPEQVHAVSALTPQCDLFTCGAMLWELLATRRFLSGSRAAIERKLLEHNLPSLSANLRGGQEVSPELVKIVERTLATDADQRPSSALALAEELERAGHALASREEVAQFIGKLSGQRFDRRTAAVRSKSLPALDAPLEWPIEVPKGQTTARRGSGTRAPVQPESGTPRELEPEPPLPAFGAVPESARTAMPTPARAAMPTPAFAPPAPRRAVARSGSGQTPEPSSNPALSSTLIAAVPPAPRAPARQPPPVAPPVAPPPPSAPQPAPAPPPSSSAASMVKTPAMPAFAAPFTPPAAKPAPASVPQPPSWNTAMASAAAPPTTLTPPTRGRTMTGLGVHPALAAGAPGVHPALAPSVPFASLTPSPSSAARPPIEPFSAAQAPMRQDPEPAAPFFFAPKTTAKAPVSSRQGAPSSTLRANLSWARGLMPGKAVHRLAWAGLFLFTFALSSVMFVVFLTRGSGPRHSAEELEASAPEAPSAAATPALAGESKAVAPPSAAPPSAAPPAAVPPPAASAAGARPGAVPPPAVPATAEPREPLQAPDISNGDFDAPTLDDAQLVELFALEKRRELPSCSDRLGSTGTQYTGNDPNQSQAQLKAARRELMRGKADNAHAFLCGATAHHPGNAAAQQALAELALAEGDAAQAKAATQRALEWEPRDPLLQALLGDALAVSGDLPGARRLWLASLPAKGSEQERTRRLASSYRLLGDRALRASGFAQARSYYRRALVLTSGSFAPSVGFADSLLWLGHRRAALAWAERAARAFPKDSRIQLLYGDALYDNERPDKARAAWQAAVDAQPNNATAARRLIEGRR